MFLLIVEFLANLIIAGFYLLVLVDLQLKLGINFVVLPGLSLLQPVDSALKFHILRFILVSFFLDYANLFEDVAVFILLFLDQMRQFVDMVIFHINLSSQSFQLLLVDSHNVLQLFLYFV